MEQSNLDRAVVDRGRREDVPAAEVYVTVTDERRLGKWVGWKDLAVAIAVLAAAVVLSVRSLGSGRSVSRAAASTSSSPCVDTAGYGGLGARASAFDANNNASTSPSEPTPGTAWYVVTATARGCVTAFSLRDGASPALTARYLLLLVSYPYLPRDAKRVVNTDRCAVWKSAALERATGRAYATATAVAQVGAMPGRAEIGVTSRPGC